MTQNDEYRFRDRQRAIESNRGQLRAIESNRDSDISKQDRTKDANEKKENFKVSSSSSVGRVVKNKIRSKQDCYLVYTSPW